MTPLARKRSISLRVEPEFLENFVVVFAKIGRALCRYFRDAVHLNRTADRELYVFSGAFERNDDVVGLQLRIFNDIVRIAHQTVSDVNFVQHFAPMRDRLCAETFRPESL